MTTESARAESPVVVHDPAAWLVVLLALLIVVVVLGALVVGLSATGELPVTDALPFAGTLTPSR